MLSSESLESVPDAFLNLWPTCFLQRNMPNAETANSTLFDLIIEEEKRHATADQTNEQRGDLTTDYMNQHFLGLKHPVIEWLRNCINHATSEYLQHAGIRYPVDWSTQAWVNINRKGDYHNVHNHPHSYLSGTYYVAVPISDISVKANRSDLNPNAISFYDPRSQANMLAIKDDPQVDPEYRVMPTPGLLLLWPSYLHHFVHPNITDELRVSVSFNVVLKWRDEYIPGSGS